MGLLKDLWSRGRCQRNGSWRSEKTILKTSACRTKSGRFSKLVWKLSSFWESLRSSPRVLTNSHEMSSFQDLAGSSVMPTCAHSSAAFTFENKASNSPPLYRYHIFAFLGKMQPRIKHGRWCWESGALEGHGGTQLTTDSLSRYLLPSS